MSNILVGVSGGIAVYKACDLISKLKYLGHTTQVVMSENAEHFVSKMTFASLTGRPVCTRLWDEAENGTIDHIQISQQWADILLVAPATANIIGKFANGIADDYLTTIYMATTAQKVICPAMNTEMYKSNAVQRNLKTLFTDGCEIITPDEGRLACGTVGIGKLAASDKIIAGLKLGYPSGAI